MALIDNLRDECDDLYAFVAQLSEGDWRKPTGFWRWTTFDQVLHLLQVDRFALASATDRVDFVQLRDASRQAAQAGVELSAQARNEFGHLSKAEVLQAWREQYVKLCERLAARGAKDRVAWFGPDMSVTSMISARQMEAWAHGQDIYDLFRVARPPTSRLRNICDLGVRTFGWTFDNRDLTRPGVTPQVILSAPGGGHWTWNDGAPGRVTGSAEDFALVVTQRRAVEHTGLSCDGAAAAAWMAIAQCFAGPPADGPRPSARTRTLS